MDRTDDSRDGAGDPQTVRTGPPPAPVRRPAADSNLNISRPYAVASIAYTLPPAPELPQPPRVLPPAGEPGIDCEPPSRPLVPLTYRASAPANFGDPGPPQTPKPVPPLPLSSEQALTPRGDTLPERGEFGSTAKQPENPLSPALSPSWRSHAAHGGGEGETGVTAKRIALKALKFTAYAFAGYLALVLALIASYRFVNPPISSLMLQQRLFGEEIIQDWVPMVNISPQIVRAVLLSEDGRFCQHHGIDLLEMQAAIERATDGVPRGASTISMQVTKNLFLWPSKSYIRKAIEIPLTLAIELLWPKRRIMEVYLNIAEWGPGIFGVEAASRFHFDKAASRLNEREAAQLAVALPNPYSRDPGDPGPRTRRLASDIQARMRGAYPSQTACVLGLHRSDVRAQ